MTKDYSYAAVCSRRFTENVEEVAKALESLADEVRREGRVREVSNHGAKAGQRHVYSAQQVIHAVTWKFANLNLGSILLGSALDADEVEVLEAKGDL